MDLTWNLCPYCGTPAPGMRRENMTLDEALQPVPAEQSEAEEKEPNQPVPETTV
jgi:hypothetical protein